MYSNFTGAMPRDQLVSTPGKPVTDPPDKFLWLEPSTVLDTLLEAEEAVSRGHGTFIADLDGVKASCPFPDDKVWSDRRGHTHRSAADAIACGSGRTLPAIRGLDEDVALAEKLRAYAIVRLDSLLAIMSPEDRAGCLGCVAGLLMTTSAREWIALG